MNLLDSWRFALRQRVRYIPSGERCRVIERSSPPGGAYIYRVRFEDGTTADILEHQLLSESAWSRV